MVCFRLGFATLLIATAILITCQGSLPPQASGRAAEQDLDRKAVGARTDAGQAVRTDPPPRDASGGAIKDGGSADKGNGIVGSPTTRVGPRFFPESSIWYQDVSGAKLHPQSAAIIRTIESAGGWGWGRMQIDFGLEVLLDKGAAPFRSFIPTRDFFNNHCDRDRIPVPVAGALEAVPGLECSNNGDCHLIVLHQPTRTLYEMWRANIVGDTFYGGCLAVWDLDRVYGEKGRGKDCTSADAAGLPIAPLLFSADEVAAGSIEHALRFILPNNRIRHRSYVSPATHATSAASGGNTAPPYGTHLRLKANVDISGFSAAAQVVARAMKKYGMFLADGGNVTLTGQSDRFTRAKWSGLMGTKDMVGLEVSDFEVIDHGPATHFTDNCVREPR